MKTKLFFLVIIHSLAININAQSLAESIGAIKTHFQFYSDTTNLNVTDQFVVQRAEKNLRVDYSFGTGWGYGYQSFHIEFVTREHLAVKDFESQTFGFTDDRLEMTFYDPNNVVLASYICFFSVVDVLSDPLSIDSQFFYSIDLIDIPIVLLDKTAKIDLIRAVVRKKK